MRKSLVWFASMALLTGCNSADKIEESANRLSKAIEQSSDTLALSVPGEEYRRMIAIARTGDEAQRGQLLAQWEQLLGFDVSARFDIEIRVSFEEALEFPFELKTRLMKIPSQSLAEASCEANTKSYFDVFQNSGSRYATKDELQTQLTQEIESVFNGLSASGLQYVDRVQRRSAFDWPSSKLHRDSYGQIITTQTGFKGTINESPEVAVRRSQAADMLADAITRTIEGYEIDYGSSVVSVPYSPFKDPQHLLVAIPMDVLDEHDTFEISIQVRPSGEGGAPLPGAPRQTVVPEDFAKIAVRNKFKCGVLEREVTWLAIDIRNNAYLSASTISALEAADEALEAYNDFIEENNIPPRTRRGGAPRLTPYVTAIFDTVVAWVLKESVSPRVWAP